MKIQVLDNKRDWNNFLLGLLLAWFGVIVWVPIRIAKDKDFKGWLTKHLKVYKLDRFGLEFTKWGHKPEKGARIFPPLHPGGPKESPEYDWAYQELIQKQGLSNPKAFVLFCEKFPHLAYSHDNLLHKNARENFYKAMRNRRKRRK